MVVVVWGLIKASKLCFLILPRFEVLEGNRQLQLDPAVDGVFKGPYPIGIDPVKIFHCIFFIQPKTIKI